MPELSERDLAALHAVAADAGATRCEAGGDGPDAYLTIGTRRIAVDVATVRSPRAAQNAPPRLLFDRVARRFIDELRATLGDAAGHRLVIVTHTAPIRMPGRTGAELAQKVFDLLQSTTAGVDASAAICGNDIRIRILDGHRVDRGAVVVFIHNPKTDPAVLLDVSESLLEAFWSAADRPAAMGGAGRWLVLVDTDATTKVVTYRRVFDQLPAPVEFERILIVLGERGVEALTG